MRTALADLAERHDLRFGTSGVRGLVSHMTPDLVYAYTQAFVGTVAAEAEAVAIGHDLRPSSPGIAASCLQAVQDSGRRALFLGPLPTPALAYHCALHGLAGVMVTGSHIPFDRNGLKFYGRHGEISKPDEQAILGAMVSVPADVQPVRLPEADPSALLSYANRYASYYGTSRLAGCVVGLYEHSSVARDVVRSILQQLGAEVLSLGRTDTFVPIDTEAVRPEDVELARHWAEQHRVDAILSTDGDGDRPLIADEAGRWIRGDIVGVLCARSLGARAVVTPVSSNTVAEKCGSFGTVVRTRIGSPYVIEGMARAQAFAGHGPVAGYEANGGFLLGSDVTMGTRALKALPTRDAVLPMLALLVEARGRGCKVSDLPKALPPRFTASDRLQHVQPEKTIALVERLRGDAALAAEIMAPGSGRLQHLDLTDGLRATFSSGDIVHLRPSGNAPELRCYVESDSDSAAARLCEVCLVGVRTFLSDRVFNP